jgi:hypothetical protein
LLSPCDRVSSSAKKTSDILNLSCWEKIIIMEIDFASYLIIFLTWKLGDGLFQGGFMLIVEKNGLW